MIDYYFIVYIIINKTKNDESNHIKKILEPEHNIGEGQEYQRLSS